jgi:spore coat protein U-like protein
MIRSSRLASALLLAAVVAVTAGLLTWRTPVVSAQGQSTANMVVSTNVMRKCFITTVPLDFGTYDPIQTNATTPLDGQSTMTVSCTKGTAVTIGIDDGANAGGTQVRKMAGTATNVLTYELYRDDARTLRWGSAAGQIFDGGVAPSRDPRQFIVYGRVPGAQDVLEGAFQDTVLITVNF